MKKLSFNNIKVDVIVTSPPYNVGKKYNVYNDNREPQEFLNWIHEDVAKPSYNILKDDGSFFLNVGGKASDSIFPLKILLEFIAAGYELQNWIIWAKSVSIPKTAGVIGKQNGIMNILAEIANSDGAGAQQQDYFSIGHFQSINSPLYLNNLHESIFHLTKTGQVKIDRFGVTVPYQDKSNIDRWRHTEGKDRRDMGNLWLLTYETIRTHRDHPSPFPIELPGRCIKVHGIKSKENMIVYDPFMGIGTTALACIKLGVHYLGTEIDPEYIKIANENISTITSQKTLFD